MSPTAETTPPTPGAAQHQLRRVERGLKLLTVPLPYLAGLAARVRVSLDDRVPTMGVFASGRLVINPAFAETLNDSALIFVLSHELLHLALRTHDRARGSHHLEFNYAHDYIINDILRVELGVDKVPAGGLDMRDARKRSAEEIVLEMRRNAEIMPSKTAVFGGQETTVKRIFGPRGRGQAGAQSGPEGEAGDVLGPQQEKEMFPDDVATQAQATEAIKDAASAGLALARAVGALKGPRGDEPGATSQVVTALRGLYRTPWEVIMQRWLESVAPGERIFIRASRRGADRSDLVMPGRRREGWMLNVIIDTSGSMADEIPRALGAIAQFCDAVGIYQVRLLQCDVTVTSDEQLSPEELAEYTITGYGGSDLTPAMERLAADPQVRAVAIITDGDVQFPPDPMPVRSALGIVAGPIVRLSSALRAYRRNGAIVKVIQELVAHFERQRKLTPDEIRALLDQGLLASDAPPRMQDLCDAPGTTYYFRVTGAPDGSIWGTDVYTGDSLLATVAVHSGAVKTGETAVVKVTVMPPLTHYQGSVRNGVSSNDFGQFGTAYRVDRL